MPDHSGSTFDSPGRRRSRGSRPDPADLRQLSDSPVSLRRIARLFAPHRATLAVVVALIVLSSAVGLAQPFLVRHVIDEALPRQDVRLLLLLVGAMLAVMGLLALLVFDRWGLSVLRKGWVNLDAVWAGAFVLAGAITFFT